mmetsp:Transcript_17535/g.48424  ORF Transcript_17535/g.48424 Transcript_17535/m.48424 type:complete len:309 (-) Transcript_17535:147-1073(-)
MEKDSRHGQRNQREQNDPDFHVGHETPCLYHDHRVLSIPATSESATDRSSEVVDPLPSIAKVWIILVPSTKNSVFCFEVILLRVTKCSCLRRTIVVGHFMVLVLLVAMGRVHSGSNLSMSKHQTRVGFNGFSYNYGIAFAVSGVVRSVVPLAVCLFIVNFPGWLFFHFEIASGSGLISSGASSIVLKRIHIRICAGIRSIVLAIGVGNVVVATNFKRLELHGKRRCRIVVVKQRVWRRDFGHELRRRLQSQGRIVRSAYQTRGSASFCLMARESGGRLRWEIRRIDQYTWVFVSSIAIGLNAFVIRGR